eukprot:4807_1
MNGIRMDACGCVKWRHGVSCMDRCVTVMCDVFSHCGLNREMDICVVYSILRVACQMYSYDARLMRIRWFLNCKVLNEFRRLLHLAMFGRRRGTILELIFVFKV